GGADPNAPTGAGAGTAPGAAARGDGPEAGPDPDAALDADAAFAARVMDLVRLELRPGRSLPLGGLTEDHWVGETTVAKTFRAAAETLPGVRAGSCRITPDAPATGSTGSTGLLGRDAPRGPVRVRLEVAAPLTWTVPELAAAVRDRVLSVAEEALGMPVAAVDVRVTDMYEPDAPAPGREAGGTAAPGAPGDDPTEGPW
ncbi:Asp23/Gls24 family envelope stress response protein, partial [Streptomyces lonarensis]